MQNFPVEDLYKDEGFTFLSEEPLRGEHFAALNQGGEDRTCSPRIKVIFTPREFKGRILWYDDKQSNLRFLIELESNDQLLEKEREGQTCFVRGNIEAPYRTMEKELFNIHLKLAADAWAKEWVNTIER